MTVHEEQPVAAQPRVDDENTAVHGPESGTDDIGTEGAPEPEPVAAEPPTADHESSTAEALFAGDDVAELRSRWAGVQAAFVDNPKECVQKADHLVSDLVEHLTTGFAQARSRLEDQWSRGQDASTEDLRVALMHYREFFDRLLAV